MYQVLLEHRVHSDTMIMSSKVINRHDCNSYLCVRPSHFFWSRISQTPQFTQIQHIVSSGQTTIMSVLTKYTRLLNLRPQIYWRFLHQDSGNVGKFLFSPHWPQNQFQRSILVGLKEVWHMIDHITNAWIYCTAAKVTMKHLNGIESVSNLLIKRKWHHFWDVPAACVASLVQSLPPVK